MATPRDPQPDSGAPLDDRERALHLLSRLAFGPRPGQVDELLAEGIDDWLDRQLTPGELPAGPLRDHLDSLETLPLGPLELYELCNPPIPPGASRRERIQATSARKQSIFELSDSILRRAQDSPRQAEEVLADFWRNHLNVSYTKGFPVHAYISSYEAQVVRAHTMGDFPDMLLASAQHPAMLYYLDNALSRRPPTKGELNDIEHKARERSGSKSQGEEAAAIAAQRGINENYARELLELHTLGVDNGYKQKDVVAAAEALTGWTIHGGDLGTQGFLFNPTLHYDEDRHFLGFSLRKDKDGGPGQGLRVIEVLAKHKGTARFLATKLVRYLVNDEPPEDVVDRAARAYTKHDGNIPEMVRAIVEHDLFWDRANYRAKFKTPLEFVVSALRATGAVVEDSAGLVQALDGMGQPLYKCDDPTGYFDTAEAWLDPGVMAPRWRFALDLARGQVEGVKIPDSFFYELPSELGPLAWMRALVDAVLPAGAGTRTLAMLFEVVREEPAPDYDQLGQRVLGLLLGSPEFQEQ